MSLIHWKARTEAFNKIRNEKQRAGSGEKKVKSMIILVLVLLKNT